MDLKLSDKVESKSSVTKAEKEPSKPVESKKLDLTGDEVIPSNWSITPESGDTILATNNKTARQFKGTIKEFNALLRS